MAASMRHAERTTIAGDGSSRRAFLIGGAGMLAATATATGAAEQGEPAAKIIDTHTHFWDPTRPQGIPWPPNGGPFQSLHRPILPDEYRKLAEPQGVAGTVVVEASPWLEDNQWLLDLAGKEKCIVGVVGNLNPFADDFEKQLRRFVANPLYRGIRVGHAAVAMATPEKRVERFRMLADANLELDIIGGPEVLASAATLAGEVPDLRIVINHYAHLPVKPSPAHRDALAAAARHPKVFCKVSSLPALANVDQYRPLLDALWDSFGADRLLYGSNWPVANRDAQFGAVIGLVREYFKAKGPDASRKFFHDNSQVAYASRAR